MDNMITCPSCGAALPQGTKHCTECGAKLDAPLADAAAATAASMKLCRDMGRVMRIRRSRNALSPNHFRIKRFIYSVPE